MTYIQFTAVIRASQYSSPTLRGLRLALNKLAKKASPEASVTIEKADDHNHYVARATWGEWV